MVCSEETGATSYFVANSWFSELAREQAKAAGAAAPAKPQDMELILPRCNDPTMYKVAPPRGLPATSTDIYDDGRGPTNACRVECREC